MCTICTWTKSSQGVFTVRNMDWAAGEMPTSIWVMPRGRTQSGAAPSDPNPAKWTAKYGSVVATIFNIGTGDGLNEKGLHAAMLYLTPSDFGSRDPKLPAISVSLWVQYYLDRYATVAEAVADTKANPYQIVTLNVEGTPGVVHLHISDSTGDSAIIEIMGGKINIYQGEQCQILTNLPSFPDQLDNLKKYKGFGGSLSLPGTTSSPDRFVRANFYRDDLPAASTRQEAITFLESVAENVAQPFGTQEPERELVAPTLWRSLSDQSSLTYYFHQSATPSMVWLELANLDFSEGASSKTLPSSSIENTIGEQSKALVDSAPFKFELL